jgi:hypothetical protein
VFKKSDNLDNEKRKSGNFSKRPEKLKELDLKKNN